MNSGILILLSTAIGGIGFVLWRFRDVIFAELNKLTFWKIKEEKRKESTKIRTLKKDEHQQAIINLFNIMKLQEA